MSDRLDRRKSQRVLDSIIIKAKKDMETWMLSLEELPTEEAIKAFQAGYIAGINRGSNVKK